MARKPHPPFRKITEVERQIMKDMYLAGHSSYVIGAHIQRSFKVVLNHLRDMGVPIRDDSKCQKTRTLNETYFQRIDTPEKAYILGLIYADGNLRGNRLKIALWEKDRYLLEAILREFGSDAPLGVEKRRKPNHSDMHVLTVFGREFCGYLRTHGMTERKELRTHFPKLPDELVRYFILGYFDGDGSVTSYVQSDGTFCYSVFIAGYQSFLLAMDALILSSTGFRGALSHSSGKGCSLSYHSTKALRVLNLLYTKTPAFNMERKYERYRGIIVMLDKFRYRKAKTTLPMIDEAMRILDHAA